MEYVRSDEEFRRNIHCLSPGFTEQSSFGLHLLSIIAVEPTRMAFEFVSGRSEYLSHETPSLAYD